MAAENRCTMSAIAVSSRHSGSLPVSRNAKKASPDLVSTVASFTKAAGARSECIAPAALWVVRISVRVAIEHHRERFKLRGIELSPLAKAEHQSQENRVLCLEP